MDLDSIRKKALGKGKSALYTALRGAYRASGAVRMRKKNQNA